MRAVVFGEISQDIIIQVNDFTSITPGSVLRGNNYVLSNGGHGSNQAVALSRLGIDTSIVARVGRDTFSKDMLDYLRKQNVDTKNVIIEDENAGLAILLVADGLDYKVFSFVEGVNKLIDLSDVDRFAEATDQKTDVALFQLGYPVNIVLRAAKIAKGKGICTILDPTPITGLLPEELFLNIDIFAPNQNEASDIVGFEIMDEFTLQRAADIMHKKGVPLVIIKLGEYGAFCSSKEGCFIVPAFPVKVKDTIGAGDAFLAGVIYALLSKLPIREAITWGNASGALSCTGIGAQSGLTDLNTLRQFIDENSRIR